MDLKKVKDSWRTAMMRLAEYGIPVFMLRDPFHKRPSLPFTMMIISILLVIIGIVGKLSALVGGIDKGNAMQFLTTSAALYFGHSWVSQSTTRPNGEVEKTDLETDNTNPN